MGAVAHLILLVLFFALAGHQLAQAFKLPSASKLLLVLAVVAAWPESCWQPAGPEVCRDPAVAGRAVGHGQLADGAASPVKLALLAGGSA